MTLAEDKADEILEKIRVATNKAMLHHPVSGFAESLDALSGMEVTLAVTWGFLVKILEEE